MNVSRSTSGGYSFANNKTELLLLLLLLINGGITAVVGGGCVGVDMSGATTFRDDGDDFRLDLSTTRLVSLSLLGTIAGDVV